MSDGVDITHGGAISVDPEALRAVAESMSRIAPTLADAAAAIRSAHAFIVATPKLSGHVDTVALWASGQRIDVLHDECRTASVNTLLMADVYEVVELRAQLAALAIQDSAQAFTLNARIAQLVASDPRVAEMETWLLAAWKDKRFEGLRDQLDLGPTGPAGAAGPDLGALLGLAAMVAATGTGRVAPNATLSGSGGPVSATPVKTNQPIAPPTSLAEALRRFPTEQGAQLKVEKYTMPNGTNRFVLYAKGTQVSVDPKEPFDLKSNLDLYTGQESASYVATLEALEAAGAQPGDEVHVYAHSQSAMNAAYLSSQSEFEVTVQVTAGSPVHPAVGEDQLLIEFRHTDDAVSSLAGGGSPGGTGSPDSIVITRDGDPSDLLLPAHLMESYAATAEMVDASGDVRLDAWLDKARELNEAVAIESTEYVARRE
ncbi:hypothetical protein [Microbacterium murale]|uniref:Uncharacterized protein n=1 Tax=Microbacterium murale TaxID=1081040 RepID=A0ABU0P7K5_9MICO|nr:hypothetical protein [Microbacterium murale]MDQ0643318.1 hypothetical protein [Microbacterium murale]